MTLDEAIKECYDIANSNLEYEWDDPKLASDCRKDHLQIAKWLEELKAYRERDKGNDLMTPLQCAERNGDIW